MRAGGRVRARTSTRDAPRRPPRYAGRPARRPARGCAGKPRAAGRPIRDLGATLSRERSCPPRRPANTPAALGRIARAASPRGRPAASKVSSSRTAGSLPASAVRAEASAGSPSARASSAMNAGGEGSIVRNIEVHDGRRRRPPPPLPSARIRAVLPTPPGPQIHNTLNCGSDAASAPRNSSSSAARPTNRRRRALFKRSATVECRRRLERGLPRCRGHPVLRSVVPSSSARTRRSSAARRRGRDAVAQTYLHGVGMHAGAARRCCGVEGWARPALAAAVPGVGAATCALRRAAPLCDAGLNPRPGERRDVHAPGCPRGDRRDAVRADPLARRREVSSRSALVGVPLSTYGARATAEMRSRVAR